MFISNLIIELLYLIAIMVLISVPIYKFNQYSQEQLYGESFIAKVSGLIADGLVTYVPDNNRITVVTRDGRGDRTVRIDIGVSKRGEVFLLKLNDRLTSRLIEPLKDSVKRYVKGR